MNSDPLLINKLAAAVLVAGLLGMVSAEIAGGLFHIEGDIDISEQAFVIATPSNDAGATEMAEEEPAGPTDILPMLATASVEEGANVARKCQSCHTFEAGGPARTGPNLYNIVNADIAAADFAYSDVLNGMEGVWDYEALNGFLYAPADYSPGTRMSFRGVRNDQDRADLIVYLRSLSDSPAPLP
ncbi:MAG: cytochrome c family protein [Alphaproteobacteria bacterium]